MPRRKAPEDLSTDELRQLLIEKRRGARQERLEHFRRTGRVIAVPPESSSDSFDKLSSSPVVETPGENIEAETMPPQRRLTDRILLGVEILAVVGLVGVLLSGLGMLRDLNLEVASALNPSTPTPTPLIMAVVLPDGHTPPDAQGNTQPNEAEIPPNLLPIVQSLANLPIPTPGPDQALRIEIPALTLDAPVVQGDGWDELKKGVAQHIGSANPGESGNVVLSAHDDVYGELFRNLDKLQPGDQVILYSALKQFVYIVDRTEIVEPTAVEVMASTGAPSVTLISCYPYLVDKQRIVVFARLQN
ncbi:MAG: class D sortase [Anaerolineales bacterium]